MADDRVVFQCPFCKAVITRPLLPLRPDQPICFEDGTAAIPEGFFGVKTPEHPDSHRLAGCCGLDGMDGPNLVCPNGHEIGTEKSDCWMPHAAVLLDSVVQVNRWNGPADS